MKITDKTVQTHFECACGKNEVYQESYPIKWKDLPKAGIVRRKDKSTGKPFLLQRIKTETCSCNEEF